jgi:hypothetical protein
VGLEMINISKKWPQWKDEFHELWITKVSWWVEGIRDIGSLWWWYKWLFQNFQKLYFVGVITSPNTSCFCHFINITGQLNICKMYYFVELKTFTFHSDFLHYFVVVSHSYRTNGGKGKLNEHTDEYAKYKKNKRSNELPCMIPITFKC